jgi:uncharacterized protein YkwD
MDMRAGLAALAAGAMTLCASAAVAAPLILNKQLILAEHNKYRAAVGARALTWSNKLAEGAQHWADTIALLGQMKHSARPMWARIWRSGVRPTHLSQR